ncbi:MAG: AMP-binding protein, partial [Lachnoclostridium sp.]|nr:AMP-binding protein [Lachnoclostridium sp.]
MNPVLDCYLKRKNFSSYEEFMENYQIEVPEHFNFGYDVVDKWADLEPDKQALLWCNDEFRLESFTFAEAKKLTNQAANAFIKAGIKKGDVVMLILKQRPEAWWCITALCKIGAICIPATFQLTAKDIIYRCNIANVKMIVAVDEEDVIQHIQDARDKCEDLRTVALVGDKKAENCLSFRDEMNRVSEDLERIRNNSTDPMLIYFSSGTSGMPKMVLHDHTLALGHIVTALYWQQVQNNAVHMTQTDSGWAKFAWGKIYGQWICGAAIGAYDTAGFSPESMLKAIETIRPTTFCAPATIYRYLIKEDLSTADFSFIKHASVAGEPLNPEVYHQIRQKTGLAIHEGFGQSEGSVLLANFGWDEI